MVTEETSQLNDGHTEASTQYEGSTQRLQYIWQGTTHFMPIQTFELPLQPQNTQWSWIKVVPLITWRFSERSLISAVVIKLP